MDRPESLARQVLHYQTATDLEFKTRLGLSIMNTVIPKLRAYVYMRLLPSVAEDVVQKVLIAVTNVLEAFKGTTDAEVWALCWTITRRKVADSLRADSRNREDASGDKVLWKAVEASTVEAPLSAADRIDLKDAMLRLKSVSEPCHDYLLGHFLLGQGFDELGEIHGLSAGAMRVKIYRCKKLARELNTDQD